MTPTTKKGVVFLLSLFILSGTWVAWRLYQGKTLTGDRNTAADSGLPRIIVTVDTRGGLCVYGGCNEKFTLYVSGQYRITRSETDRDEDRVLRAGTLPSETTIRFLDLIESTDFAALRTTPFTDICPTAYDGSETTYTFVLENGQKEILDTCQHVFDFDQPILREVRALPTVGQ